MGINWHEYVLSVCQFALYAALIRGGVCSGLIRRFPVFYGFVFWRMAIDLGGWAALLCHSRSAPVFVEYYSFGIFGDRVFVAAILVRFLLFLGGGDGSFERGSTLRLNWPLFGVPTSVLGWLLASRCPSKAFVHQGVSVAALQLELALGWLAVLRCCSNRRLILGMNDLGILAGLTLKTTLDYGLLALLSLEWADYAAVQPWIQPMALLPWAIWAVMLRSDRPSKQLSGRAALLLARLQDRGRSVRRRIRGLQKPAFQSHRSHKSHRTMNPLHPRSFSRTLY